MSDASSSSEQRTNVVTLALVAMMFAPACGATSAPTAGDTTSTSPDDSALDVPEAASSAPDAPAPAAPAIDPTALPTITSGDGITVDEVRRVSARTFDVALTTRNVSGRVKTNLGNGVRITLPAGYATSGKRYPVLYFLHGATCDYTTVSQAIDIEEKTTSEHADVIVVMPEGGRLGLYTDWLDQSVAQRWMTYHLTELVPFIDRNLRTVATKQGRGIVGFSMGGLGAMRYAFERPELFAAAAAFSGVLDLQHAAFQTGLTVALGAERMNVIGPFGDPLFSSMWGRANPSRHPNRFETVETFIYVGGGTDPVEALTKSQTQVFDAALSRAQVPHFFKDYGAPGKTPEGTCNGEHSLTCARYAFADALPRVMAVLANAR